MDCDNLNREQYIAKLLLNRRATVSTIRLLFSPVGVLPAQITHLVGKREKIAPSDDAGDHCSAGSARGYTP